ncbi:MAG: 3'-5' exoribonuclease [Deltaproteobacteria bacterium]|nr:3'-5' exoribonuclease [Deltaproteobacteria bacterium]
MTELLPPETLEAFRSLCDGAPLAVFDLETTGPDRLTDRIVEVAVVRVSPDGSVAVFETRVNPGMKIPREATAVHGITDVDVADAPAFAAVAPGLAAFLEGCDVTGYNLRGFDLPLLTREFDRVKVPFSFEGRRVVDAHVINFRKEPRDLSAAVRTFVGREHTGAHSALADAIASAEVLAGQLKRYDDLPRGIDELAAFTAPVEGRWVDTDKRFVWRDGVAVFNFGGKRGQPLADVATKNPEYLEWMLDADFPEEAKRIVREAREGRFPARK